MCTSISSALMDLGSRRSKNNATQYDSIANSSCFPL